MDSRIQGVLPQGLKPTLPFEALCRPATHPLGGFPGRALVTELFYSEFFNRFLRAWGRLAAELQGLRPGRASWC